MRGLFITLEGGDGSGKSTQIRNIEKFFTEKGLVVLHTREPGGPRISEKLREILLDTGNTEMEAVTEMFIYAAARAQHVRETVIPALERGEIVICDRFVDSSIAYQAYGRCLGDMVAEVNRHATGGLSPDLTIWLDIDPETGKARASGDKGPDRLDLETSDFHERVREGYKAIAKAEPDRFKGSDEYLKCITKEVTIPVLRKDFTIDPYMIYQAKIMGASAVLLIAAILSDEELRSFYEIADTLGLSCLFEAHDDTEVKRCLNAGATIVGVNNRNLKDFTVDINNSIRLRSLVPEDIIFVSESGIEKPEDVKILKENGTDAVLIGEMLMRSSDKGSLIKELKEVM